MSSILPPSNRLWWKESIDKTEWTWIGIAFVWGMIMFVMMIYWHIYGKQNLSNEAYKTTPEMFAAKAEKFIGDDEANSMLKRAERPGYGIFNLLAKQKA